MNPRQEYIRACQLIRLYRPGGTFANAFEYLKFWGISPSVAQNAWASHCAYVIAMYKGF